ncbi:signal peptidase I [Acidobacteriota bacterium]
MDSYNEKREVKPRNPWGAAGLSLCGAGLGQLYNGQVVKSVIFYAAPYLLFGLTVVTGILSSFQGWIAATIAMLVMRLAFLLDAALVAGKRREYILKASNKWYIYLLIGLLFSAFVSPAVAIVKRAFFYQTYKIPTGSMHPTLMVGDYVAVSKVHYRLHPVQRGEIVVYRYPKDPSREFTHRMIGLPGDVLEIKNKTVYINGQPLVEPYAYFEGRRASLGDNMPSRTVPSGHYFLLGDNRDNANDSRYWGSLPQGLVVGKVLFVRFSALDPKRADFERREFSPPWKWEFRSDRIGKKIE